MDVKDLAEKKHELEANDVDLTAEADGFQVHELESDYPYKLKE